MFNSKQFISFLFFVFVYTSGWACRCLQEEAEFMHFVNAKHVFLGYVCTVNDCGDNNKYKVKMYVESAYKGDVSNKLEVYTDCVTSCKFKLESGKTYIFFTDLNNNNIGYCEKRVEENTPEFNHIKGYLDKIKRTSYNSVTIQDMENKNIADVTVREGALDGLVRVYYPDGRIRMRGVYVKGKAYGNFEITNHGKRFTQVWSGNYQNGLKEGKWVYKRVDQTNKQSLIYEHITYKDGEEISRLRVRENQEQIKYFEEQLNNGGN